MLKPELPLRTERLLLRAFDADSPTDFEQLHDYRSRPDVARYLLQVHDDLDATRERLTAKAGRTVLTQEGDPLDLAVVEPEGGRIIGDVVLIWTSEPDRTGEVGFVFHPDYGGRGYATEAAAEMVRLGFEELGLHRVIGRLDARNTASARVMERLGMRREAHFVKNEWLKGEWTDELVYAILEEEWRAAQDVKRSVNGSVT